MGAMSCEIDFLKIELRVSCILMLLFFIPELSGASLFFCSYYVDGKFNFAHKITSVFLFPTSICRRQTVFTTVLMSVYPLLTPKREEKPYSKWNEP